MMTKPESAVATVGEIVGKLLAASVGKSVLGYGNMGDCELAVSGTVWTAI